MSTLRRPLAIAVALLLANVLALATEIAVAGGKSASTLTAPGGVTVRGSGHRYIAMSPGTPGKLTVVARVERRGGRLSRWWYLGGSYHVPAVAYDLSPGGLSADGRTLVLSRFSRTYPPRVSRFAILDTKRSFRWRGSGRPPRFRRFVDFVELDGDFGFHAISPDGSTIFLIHRFLPPSSGGAYISTYEVRALDVRSGELLPRPIAEADEQMRGLPITQVTSPGGRWAYTLYDGDGEPPFIDAVDTVSRRAASIELPQLERERNLFMLGLHLDRHHSELEVVRRRFRAAGVVREPLLTVDTRSFEVSDATPQVADSGIAWLPIGVASLAVLLGIAWMTGRGRGRPNAARPERP